MFKELSESIRNSKIFLCCITKKYSESKNCIKEINYAATLDKKFIVLMWERLQMDDLNEVGFIINPLVRYNCYQHKEILQSWSGPYFEYLMHNINKLLNRDTNNDSLPYPNRNPSMSRVVHRQSINGNPLDFFNTQPFQMDALEFEMNHPFSFAMEPVGMSSMNPMGSHSWTYQYEWH